MRPWNIEFRVWRFRTKRKRFRAPRTRLNFLFWLQLLGCTIVGFAVYLRVSYGGYISLLPQHGILSLDAVLLMLGFLLFTTAFLGCCGAWCKNQCLLVSVINLFTTGKKSLTCITTILCKLSDFYKQIFLKCAEWYISLRNQVIVQFCLLVHV